MKKIKPALLFVLTTLLTAMAPAVYAQNNDVPENPRYIVLKGGRYTPSEKYDISNFNAGTTTSHLDMTTRSSGEIALGQFSDSQLALELGIGYFETKGSPGGSEPGSIRLKAVPIVITAKDHMSTGPLRPYFEFGVGAYFTKLEVSGNSGSFSSQSKTTYGFHGGAGFNIDIGSAMFIGLEGRYLWVKANYGQPIKLDGFMRTINIGFNY